MIKPVLFPFFSGKLIVHKEPPDNPRITNGHGNDIRSENLKKSVKRLLNDTYERISKDQMKKVDETSNVLKEIVKNKLPQKDTVTFNFHLIKETSVKKYSSGSFINDLFGHCPMSYKIDYKPGYKLNYISGLDGDLNNSEIILPVDKIDKAISWINKIVKKKK